MALTPFEGHAVVGATLKITNTGDGLSKSMNLDPTEYDGDQEVTVVLRGRISDISFKASKDDPDARIRQHTLRAETVMVVDGSFADSMIAEQRERIRIAKEQAEGIQSLDV